MNCLLCQSERLQRLAPSLGTDSRPDRASSGDHRIYHHCKDCEVVFLDPLQRMKAEDEKKRYLLHNNQIEDPAYQKFVLPLVEAVQSEISPGSRGLDFGSGTGPVLSYLLRNEGYIMSEYDAFFNADKNVFSHTYDFVVSCEVVEHLYHPLEEFEKLARVLRPGGLLVIQTQMWQGEDLFKWYYSRDPSHVVFYNPTNLEWLKTRLQMQELRLKGSRLAVFKK